MAVNYVKFFRGTPLAFENAIKNSDTLYFITETDSQKGALYLGEKLIASSVSSVADFEDVLLTELANNQVLVYSEESDKWINKSFIDAIGIMVGATEEDQGSNGLVPAPPAKAQEMFLRGDGTWAIPEGSSTITVSGDEKSISIENSVISLKNFGKQYYKYIEATEIEAAKYILQIVDNNNPWKEYLEPKVIKENNELVIGWFEPNPTTIEGVQDQIVELTSSVDSISKTLTENYYTKDETEAYVAQEISKQNHLIRKTFDSIEDAKTFILLEEHPEKYIYMILSTDFWGENNKYDEYIWIEGKLEKVGSWETDLSNYAKVEDLNKYVEKLDGYSLVLNTEVAKLATVEVNAQKNLFDSVNGSEFFIDINRQLNLQSLPISKVTGLEDILDTINSDLIDINSSIDELSKIVANLDNYIDKETYEEDMALIKASLKWQTI